MLASISPLGERARGNRWGLTAFAYASGAVLGAAALGALLGEVGRLLVPGRATWLVVAPIAVVAGGWDILGRPVPGPHRQVDEDWLRRYRGWVYGFGFGVQLGVGVATIVTTATVYAWMLVAALSQRAVVGLVIGAAFGGARALTMVVVRRVAEPGELRARLRTMSSWSGRARVGAGALSVAVGAGCAMSAIGGLR